MSKQKIIIAAEKIETLLRVSADGVRSFKDDFVAFGPSDVERIKVKLKEKIYEVPKVKQVMTKINQLIQ